ncbi:DEAD/DEAH box helicase [Paenibacillus herberti]|uniref:DEAD/DEAH box helicase n=1 Tax=Paenibacillus herberti TaxID=1619309 RepID=A0A229NWM8_9BACL|nr:DEAD/DEAH box helicase [Paenibacillus herberti]OXM14257.1 DEAD/DEAH box helicase [Paenibacillus herberti]
MSDQTKPLSDVSLAPFHPVLGEWFSFTFGSPTDVQRRSWKEIRSGAHTLLAAPTGSGKTLAALLPCLDRVLRAKEDAAATNPPQPGVRVLYITPLKALNNDIYDHVTAFVEEIGRLYEERQSKSSDASKLAGSEDSGISKAGKSKNSKEKSYRETLSITCAVRTGDTPASKRAAMLRRPPDVLVTTPESLYILLGSAKGRVMLQTAEQVIVDEIHSLAADKRGSHLSLTLERLEAWCGRPLQRIGLSATQKPMDRVARFLGGWSAEAPTADGGEQALLGESTAVAQTYEPPTHPLGYRPRPVAIIESAMSKSMQVSVTMPDNSRLHNNRESVWFPIMDRILQLMEGCRSVLIFVNSRRMAERLCLRMNDYTGHEMCRAHHGSMDRGRRLEVERLLKGGQLRCIVATSSLELGIDVGHVDLVIQMDSPLSAAAGIQRIGRAGHSVGDVSRGVILARQRGSLPEIAVLSRMIAERDIESIEVPRDALDVLSQQTVAMASGDTWTLDGLYRLIVGSDSYRAFPRERLESMLAVLAGLYPFARPLLEWDREGDLIGPRSNSRMAAVTGAGTIPQSGAYPVHHADSRSHIGELDEEFVQESRVGDVFQLGTNSWTIRLINKDRIYVTETSNSFSEIPFWRNEAGSRSYLLGERVAALWADLLERLQKADADEAMLKRERNPAALEPAVIDPDAAMDAGAGSPSTPDARAAAGADSASILDAKTDADNEPPFSVAEGKVILHLREQYSLDDRSARGLAALARAQMVTGVVPTATSLAVEVYKDIAGQTHIVIHNAWGRRVNRTWQLAIERRFENTLPYRLYGNAKDNGIEFVLPEWEPSWLQAVHGVTPETLPSLLMEALPGSPLLAVAFRRIAETSLLLSRSYTRTPMWQMRLRGEGLLRAALPFADRFPYLGEAMRECLNVYLDSPRLTELLERMKKGEITLTVHRRERPSPLASQFAAEYVNMRIYEGDGLDRAVQTQLLQMSRELAGELFGQEALLGAIDPQVLAAERQRLEEPDSVSLRNADELYQLLKQRGDSSEEELLGLAAAAVVAPQTAASWLRQLQEQRRLSLYEPGDGLPPRFICGDEAELYARFPQEQDAEMFVVERYISTRLGFTPVELAKRYPALGKDGAKHLTARLLEADRIQRAPFAEGGEALYSSSLTAARIIRLSVQAARGRSEAVDAIRWCSLIASRQHALQGTQLRGEHGLLQVLEQLQGFFFPLSHWESFILPSRLASYRPEELDLLCASGEVLWLGRREDGEKEGKIAFFLPDSKDLYTPYLKTDGASSHPELLQRLKQGGAMFLTRLARELDRPPSEVQAELLELVWEGHVSNDQFAPLRSTGSGKRSKPKAGRAAGWGGSGLGRWFWTGSLQRAEETQTNGASADDRRHVAEDSKLNHAGVRSGTPGTSDEGTAPGRSKITAERTSEGATGPGPSPLNSLGRPLPEAEGNAEGSPIVRWIYRLLDTFGIISRDLAAAASPYAWEELLPSLKRLEEWGVLVRGHLIQGMPAMQFTTREIADAVRRPLPQEEGSGLTVISAADPANPFGLLANWPDSESGGYARKPGNYLVLENGRWLYWIENNGRRIHSLDAGHPSGNAHAGHSPGAHDSAASQDADVAASYGIAQHSQADESAGSASSSRPHVAASLQEMLASIATRQGLAKVTVEEWNGKPVDETEGAELLRGLGAERDRHRFILWKSQLTRR